MHAGKKSKPMTIWCSDSQGGELRVVLHLSASRMHVTGETLPGRRWQISVYFRTTLNSTVFIWTGKLTLFELGHWKYIIRWKFVKTIRVNRRTVFEEIIDWSDAGDGCEWDQSRLRQTVWRMTSLEDFAWAYHTTVNNAGCAYMLLAENRPQDAV